MKLRNIFIIYLFFIFTLNLHAGSEEEYHVYSKRALCSISNKNNFVQNKLLKDKNSHLAFINKPVISGRSICWWHSRFTRAAAYLAVFRPDLQQMPTTIEAKKIIAKIIKMDSIVEIPYFKNLSEFSAAYSYLIQKELAHWAVLDVITFKHLEGIRGRSSIDSNTLKQMMDKLYYDVSIQGRTVFQLLKLPGLEIHSWLVVKMEPIHDGYKIYVIDSNFIETQQWIYHQGQHSFYYEFNGPAPQRGSFVPYTFKRWVQEENEIRANLRAACAEFNQ